MPLSSAPEPARPVHPGSAHPVHPAPGHPVHPVRPTVRAPYRSLYLASLQQALAHRRAVLVDLAGNAVWAAVLYYLWRSIFAGATSVGGYSWDQMRTYVLLSFALGQLLAFQAEMQMHRDIRSGQVALDLVRPVNYPAMQLVRALGAGTPHMAGALAGTAVIGGMLLHALPPQSPAAALLFLITLAVGVAVNAMLCFLTSLLCFWTESAYGLILARQAVTTFMAGGMVPLALFPAPLRVVAEWLPFSAIVSTPVQMYLGRLTGDDALLALGRQLAWTVVMSALTVRLWRAARRHLTVNGG
ncbi:ABC transporter permease [Streptomyces sp. NBC_01445]|uniref:ABC transporter permease n=1 Tax=Streptomyces sp. NBC_01445 TaxID=2903869 RepID=UPI002DDC75BA|nr:ABC-2 family transporter protein [Streptomyces sp. NBC_01445]WSE04427.1 ABC-2 family transporter protein [Streptomyces sp. NBC_01445]